MLNTTNDPQVAPSPYAPREPRDLPEPNETKKPGEDESSMTKGLLVHLNQADQLTKSKVVFRKEVAYMV